MSCLMSSSMSSSMGTTSTSMSSNSSSAEVCASPRSLVGLAGDLLRQMAGASEGTQRRRFKAGLEILLKEYFESGDMGEAARCLAELVSWGKRSAV